MPICYVKSCSKQKCRIHYLIYFYYDLLLLIFPLYLYCLFLFINFICFILVFFTSFFCLDRWSIPSRQFSILWSYLDIILLFSSYLYSFSLLINSSWLLVFAIILFVLIFPYILGSLIFFSYHFWCRDLLCCSTFPSLTFWESLSLFKNVMTLRLTLFHSWALPDILGNIGHSSSLPRIHAVTPSDQINHHLKRRVH